MKIKKELIKRKIGGEAFLVPVGKTVYDARGMFILTELGEFIWDLLPDAEGVDDILQAVLRDYEVAETRARADIEAFLQKLRGMDILD